MIDLEAGMAETYRGGCFCGRFDLALRQDISLVYPDFNADPTHGRLCFSKTVIDVGPERVKRYLAVMHVKTPGDFSPA